jgi:hypothetical protein
MKLRGAFDPRIQFLLGAIMIAVFVSIVVELESGPYDPQIVDWLRLDLRVMPISLLLGIVVGLVIGHWRLQALRQVLPEIDGHWFLGQGDVLSRVRQGANATRLQRLGFAVAFVACFSLSTETNGRVVLFGSMGAYALGQFLAGQTLPFLRLFIELKKNPVDIS